MEIIMPINVDKVSESDQDLSELDDQSEVPPAKASPESRAAKQISKYWWKNVEVPEKVQLLTRWEVETKKS